MSLWRIQSLVTDTGPAAWSMSAYAICATEVLQPAPRHDSFANAEYVYAWRVQVAGRQEKDATELHMVIDGLHWMMMHG